MATEAILNEQTQDTVEERLMAGEELYFAVKCVGGVINFTSPNCLDHMKFKGEAAEKGWEIKSDDYQFHQLFILAKKFTSALTSPEQLAGMMSFADCNRIADLVGFLLGYTDKFPKEFAGAAISAPPSSGNPTAPPAESISA